ncbi:MAG: hypothetical protein V1933_04535 [Candidatus Omnitrophota bacterium]
MVKFVAILGNSSAYSSSELSAGLPAGRQGVSREVLLLSLSACHAQAGISIVLDSANGLARTV